MSRFKKLSHTLWHCQYHIVWTPKYRLRILEGEVSQEVLSCVRAFIEQKNCEVSDLGVQKDHVHIVVMIAPKLCVSDYMGIIKSRTAIRVFNKFRKLKKKPYWGNHFWSRGYCVDTVGLDADEFFLSPLPQVIPLY
jgi:putative transposase